MVLSAEAVAYIDAIRDVPQPPNCTIDDFRAALGTIAPAQDGAPLDRVEEVVLRAGASPLGGRVYVPPGAEDLPLVVWLHGGSFVRGHLDAFDGIRAALAHHCRCVVVAVDQRLSPEARFPVPLDDALDGLRWAVSNAEVFGANGRHLGIGGESSGANLAAAASLRARDEHGPALRFQILVVPLLDATLSCPSVEEFGSAHSFDRAQLDWAYDQYAPGIDRSEPLLSPLLADDLSSLPPALIVTAEFDPVRDEGERYAARLRSAGVAASSLRIDGAIHHLLGQSGAMAVIQMGRELLESTRPQQSAAG